MPRDLGAPVHVPYVFREYPKCLYHPTKKTEASIAARNKAETYNQLHPANPQTVPELLPVTMTAHNKTEERKAFGLGFIDRPPNPEGWTAPDPPAAPQGEGAELDMDSMTYQAATDVLDIDFPNTPVTKTEARAVQAKLAPKKAAKKGR